MTKAIDSIDQIERPPVARDSVTVKFPPFVGEALTLIQQLQKELRDAHSAEDVFLKGLGLLASARGHDILLRDRETKEAEVVNIWA